MAREMNLRPGATLAQYGERAILEDVVLPRFGIQSDDCATLAPVPAGHDIVMTMDPCPTPVVCLLEQHLDGKPVDYWHYGRLTVLINVSDLAAMGARPAGLLVSTVMPADMPMTDYDRFLDGLEEAGEEWGCPVLGGNIKDGDVFTATGTAVGTVPRGTALARTGASTGDLVCVIGDMGLFWSAVLARLRDVRLDGLDPQDSRALDQALYRPSAKVEIGMALAAEGLVTACMDASDGVSGCLVELARRNRGSIHLDESLLAPSAPVAYVAEALRVDPRSLMLAWGNWELVVTTPPGRLDALMALAARHGTTCRQIGELRDPKDHLVLLDGEEVTDFSSERFTNRSYFTHGLNSYADWLLKQTFTVPPAAEGL
ncbi:AIR synthase related protein [Nonomuraea sp. NPDC049709]|uniref:thiamine-phosphate kinase n=1 Tax=Nonomuraea sp. NPDC049709 TaxID=3154736 RepID=UPI0034486885